MPPDIGSLLALLAAAFDGEVEFGVAYHLGAVTGMRRRELAELHWQWGLSTPARSSWR